MSNLDINFIWRFFNFYANKFPLPASTPKENTRLTLLGCKNGCNFGNCPRINVYTGYRD